MDQQDSALAIQGTFYSTSPSANSRLAANTQPPRASLLGLPKELLNHIIILAVVNDPDTDPTARLSKQRPNVRLHGRVRVFSSPALARTCTALEAIVWPIYYGQNTFDFCSSTVAFQWLSQERRKRCLAPVRRIRIHYRAMRWELALEVYLEDETNLLAVTVECSYYVDGCTRCWSRLLSKIEEINDRGLYLEFDDMRLATLAYHLHPWNPDPWTAYGCTICGIWW